MADEIEIQRTHRIGKRSSSDGKPKQIIARFLRALKKPARPFLLVALLLTAFAGYFSNCVIVCCNFVLSFLLTSLETNMLIALYTRVEDVHSTYDLSFMCMEFCIHIHWSTSFIMFVASQYFYET